MTEVHSCSYYCDRPECIKAQRDELRERLAQPEQKPMHPTLQKMWEDYFDKCYKREWIGLTDEEELMIGVATGLTGVAIRMIEAKLREKNT